MSQLHIGGVLHVHYAGACWSVRRAMTDRQHQQKAEGEKCQLFVLSYLTDLVKCLYSVFVSFLV